MHIRTFRAANLHAALEEIRRQMGPEASVLHTRQVRDGWLGWLGRTRVEVTAGLRDAGRPAAAPGSQTATSSAAGSPLAAGSPSGTGTDAFSADFAAAGVARLGLGERPDDQRPGRVGLDARSMSADRGPTGSSEHVSASDLAYPGELGYPGDLAYRGDAPFRLPPTLREYHDELTRVGVPPRVARRWVDAASSFTANLGEPIGPPAWREQLQQAVARDLKLAGPIRTHPGDRRVVALVGPTGVGKTTTIAKLAAGFRIEARRRVGLLTIDTFRIAAVQQLKAYAEIMDLPMEVVERVDEMRAALDRLGDVDLVLIDTAGRSPQCDARIEQLSGLLGQARPDETHLVLSATSSPQSVASILDGFAPVRPTAAILTKLDETVQTAGVLAALTASASASGSDGTALSYVTTGQQVPDDIELASAETLVHRLLPENFAPSYLDAA